MSPYVHFDIAYIAPVAVSHVPEQGLPLPEQEREEVARKIEVLPRRYELKHFWLEDVDSGVYGVGEHLRPARLFQETLNATALVGDDHTIFQGIIYLGEQDGGDGALPSVEFQRLREVEIGQEVAGDHYESLVEVLL